MRSGEGEELSGGLEGVTLSRSTQGTGWEFAKAKDNLTTDPGWANTTYDSVNEFLRIDLGSSHNVCRVGYIPRQLNPTEDGSWNGAGATPFT